MTSASASGNGAALRLRDVHASYGPVPALHGVDLEVPQGAVVTLLGANGAGKSTVLRVISGMLPVTSGRIEHAGASVAGHRPSALVRRGIVHVPEGRQIFGEMSVEENLRLGAFTRPLWADLRPALQLAFDLFPVLAQRRRQRAGTLSGGEQQMLAIGRALMARPGLLLLDEPSLALAPLIVQEIYRTVRTLNKEQGVTILLVEQNASMALDVADYAYVLETGRVAVGGTPGELRGNEAVRRSYLGY